MVWVPNTGINPRTGFKVFVKPTHHLLDLPCKKLEHYTTVFLPTHGTSLCREYNLLLRNNQTITIDRTRHYPASPYHGRNKYLYLLIGFKVTGHHSQKWVDV